MLLVTTICELEYLTVNAAMQHQSSTVVLHDTKQRGTLQEGNPQPNPTTHLISKMATASRFAHTPSAERSTLANMERLQASRPQTTAQTWMQRTCCVSCTSSQVKLWRIRCTYMHLYVPVKEWEQSHYAKKHMAAGHSGHPLCRSSFYADILYADTSLGISIPSSPPQYRRAPRSTGTAHSAHGVTPSRWNIAKEQK